ncbi:hypothetical protein AVEN_108664-1 [Araneus ventricosus]|uniref:Uncharacterized protein n=1 Tax=Araneus ventricosus TaxID=182803 RepID=A0A4Y2PT44_ARAVE|nr:hypothetical protein AVEN_108664-1 [Araneus ventricosus]
MAFMARKEVMEVLAPLTAPIGSNTTSRHSVPIRSPPRREARNSAIPMRKTDMWRTDSNVPLCFRCGHVLRNSSGQHNIRQIRFLLFAATDYLIEENSAKQICALNVDIEGADEALIIGNKVLMCGRELSVPASIVNVESGRCKVWVTNFSRQNQLITKRINIACLTTIENEAICSLKGEDRDGSKGHKARTRKTREKLKGVFDAELISIEKEELLDLSEEFGDIFDFNGKSRKSRCNAVKHYR